MEKVVLNDSSEHAYHLALLDDSSRAYVFCDLTLNPTVCFTMGALIAAMRQYRVIPKTVLFDNGSGFKGKLLEVFCRHGRAYFDASWCGLNVTLWETLEGLEIRHHDGVLGLWRDYHTYRRLWKRFVYHQLPDACIFEPCGTEICARNAVA